MLKTKWSGDFRLKSTATFRLTKTSDPEKNFQSELSIEEVGVRRGWADKKIPSHIN